MIFIKKNLIAAKRLPQAVDHRIVVPLVETVAPFADNAFGAVGSFTIGNGTPTAGSPGPFGNDRSVLFERNGGNADEGLVGPINPSFKGNATSLTVMAWIYPTEAPSPNDGVILTKSKRISSYGLPSESVFWFWLSPGRAIGFGGDSLNSALGGTVPLNTWTHVAGTYNGTTVIAYADGEIKASASDSSGLQWGTTNGTDVPNDTTNTQANPWYIGNVQSAATYRRGFLGRIADVRVLSRAMTQAEIRDIVARRWL